MIFVLFVKVPSDLLDHTRASAEKLADLLLRLIELLAVVCELEEDDLEVVVLQLVQVELRPGSHWPTLFIIL